LEHIVVASDNNKNGQVCSQLLTLSIVARKKKNYDLITLTIGHKKSSNKWEW